MHDYEGQIRASKFCMSAYGHGWGIRTNIYMANGCVPVIIQDHVFQPRAYEDVLPYQDFSIRLPAADIPKIGDVLRAVSEAEYQRLRSQLPQYWSAFIWDPTCAWWRGVQLHHCRAQEARCCSGCRHVSTTTSSSSSSTNPPAEPVRPRCAGRFAFKAREWIFRSELYCKRCSNAGRERYPNCFTARAPDGFTR